MIFKEVNSKEFCTCFAIVSCFTLLFFINENKFSNSKLKFLKTSCCGNSWAKQSQPIIFAIYVSKMWGGIPKVRFNIVRISCHFGTPIHPFIMKEKKKHKQELFSLVILLNLNMFFSTRNKLVKIVRILLEVMAEKLSVSYAISCLHTVFWRKKLDESKVALEMGL